VRQPFSIFRNIKVARVTTGLSQREFAERLGLSDKTISAYETGRAVPPAIVIAEIAKVTGVGVANLLNDESNSKNKNNILNKLDEIIIRISNLERLVSGTISDK